jgi:hypothetical protein
MRELRNTRKTRKSGREETTDCTDDTDYWYKEAAPDRWRASRPLLAFSYPFDRGYQGSFFPFSPRFMVKCSNNKRWLNKNGMI